MLKAKPYRMQVKRIYEGDSIERFKITGGSRSIVVRNNRPELNRTRKRKKPMWQVEEGTASNPQTFALTVLAIEKKIEEIENPPKPVTHWTKN